jgi:nicotinamidase-related amidase
MSVQVPQNSAVVIVDVQAAFFRTNPPPFESTAVIENINLVLGRARQAGLPIFIVQHENAKEGPAYGSDGWQIDSRVQLEPADHRCRKTTCDAFHHSRLGDALRGLGVRTIVLAGYATEFCLDSTLRSAVAAGFGVMVVADGHTTHDSPVLEAKRIREFHNWAWPNCTHPCPVQVILAEALQFPGGTS